MRVIAGEFRSRRLISVPGSDTRPTPDRLRETLFNVLGPSVEGCLFIDCYAGTGAVGIEAISRGARKAVFLEKNRNAIEVVRKNLDSLGIANRARVIQGPAHLHLRGLGADIVFLDPPYAEEADYAACLDVLKTEPPRLTVIQHSVRLTLPGDAGPLHCTRTLKQGDNALSFYSVDAAAM